MNINDLRRMSGRLSIWLSRRGSQGQEAVAAATLEELGFGCVWISGGAEGHIIGAVRPMLETTRSIIVATGVASIWTHPWEDLRTDLEALPPNLRARLLVGLGVSHRPSVEAQGLGRYERPRSRLADYLDAIDATTVLPWSQRLVGAQGPKMLALARDRTAGAHPYLVTPEHTRLARTILGDDRFLAPELTVVLEKDPERARTVARNFLSTYMGLPNYTNNWLRLGFSETDLENGGSDRLVDDLVAWGDIDEVRHQIQTHFDAGADHVCLQVLSKDDELPWGDWQSIAEAMLEG